MKKTCDIQLHPSNYHKPSKSKYKWHHTKSSEYPKKIKCSPVISKKKIKNMKNSGFTIE